MTRKKGTLGPYFIEVVVYVAIFSFSCFAFSNHTAWSPEDEKKLVDLYKKGLSISEIRFEMERDYKSVQAKLVELKTRAKIVIADENQAYRIQLMKERKDDLCPNRVEFVYEIHNKNTGRTKEFIPDSASGPDLVYDIRLWQRKAAVLGRRGDKLLYVVSIIDVDNTQLLDRFWAYKLTPSPSSRYLSYVKFYSRHAPSNNIVAIYDLARSPSENRLPGYRDSKTECGLPVYPDENVQQKSYNQAIVPEHTVISPFLWSQNENKLVFFDIHGSQNYIVLVYLSRGIKVPIIHRVPVDPKLLIKEDLQIASKEFYRNKIDKSQKFPFVVNSLSWSETEDAVLIRPSNRINPWIIDELVITLP